MSSSQTGATCEGLFVTVSVGQSYSADSAAVLRGAACLPCICSSWFCQVPRWARPTEHILPGFVVVRHCCTNHVPRWARPTEHILPGIVVARHRHTNHQPVRWLPSPQTWKASLEAGAWRAQAPTGYGHSVHQSSCTGLPPHNCIRPLCTVMQCTDCSSLPSASPFPHEVFARSGFLYLPSKTFFLQGQQQHEVSGNNQPCTEDMHQRVSVKLSRKSLIQHACCAVQSNAIRVPRRDWLGDFVHRPAPSVGCAQHIVFCTTTNRLICTHTLCAAYFLSEQQASLERTDCIHV